MYGYVWICMTMKQKILRERERKRERRSNFKCFFMLLHSNNLNFFNWFKWSHTFRTFKWTWTLFTFVQMTHLCTNFVLVFETPSTWHDEGHSVGHYSQRCSCYLSGPLCRLQRSFQMFLVLADTATQDLVLVGLRQVLQVAWSLVHGTLKNSQATRDIDRSTSLIYFRYGLTISKDLKMDISID